MAELDFDALAVFLRVGFFVGADTPFAAVRAESPHIPIPAPASLTRDEAIDAFIDTFRQAIAARLPEGPYALPLSGGRDSRHILLTLIEAGRPPSVCVTVEHFPPRGNDDAAVAARLCARFGIRHVVLPQPVDRIAIERRKNVETEFCTDEHAQFVVLADWLRASTRVTYDGIAGDVLSQSGYLTPEALAVFERGEAKACARFVLDGYPAMVSESALSRLLVPHVYRQVPRERAIARLTVEIARHLAAPNPVASFFFWNRTRREIALSPCVLMRGITVHMPFLDQGVVNLLSSLPARLLVDRRLHTDAIARAYPHAGAIPYGTPERLVNRPAATRRLAAGLARLVVRSRGVLQAGALLPGIAATMADGHAERLWHTSLTVYLDQLAALGSFDR
jgi:asparagine synthase (glutamine-hydrolysing)